MSDEKKSLNEMQMKSITSIVNTILEDIAKENIPNFSIIDLNNI